MRKIILSSVLMCLLCLPGLALAGAASDSPQAKPLSQGNFFPDLGLEPLTPDKAAYLGLAPGTQKAGLNELKAKVVIIEIFSMYCPHCQREAPVVNEFISLLKDRGLSDKVKMIGVGAGNSQAEVDIFKNKFNPAFPLLADPNFKIHKACGEVGTPFFYLLVKDKQGYRIVSGTLGRMDSPSAFLDQIIASTGKLLKE